MSQGRDLLSRNCPNCGASLPGPTPPGMPIVCHYCGHSFQPPPDLAPRIIVVAAPRGPRPVVVARPVRRTATSFVIMMVILGLAGFMSLLRAKSHGLGSLPQLGNLPSQLVSAATSNFMWDTVAGPPIPAAVGGGVEGFVGRIRERGDDTLFIAAFDGAKLGVVWKTPPLGTYSQAYQSTFASVIGRSVIVTDYRANLHVYDLASGKETRTVKLTDRAKAMCAAPTGKGRVWIEMSDEKDVAFDVDSGALSPSARPAWCPQGSDTSGDCRGWLTRGAPRPGCAGPENAPKASGFQAINVIEDGDAAVAFGKKHPGTALPVVVGFDPKTKAVRWQEPVASGDQSAVAESSTTNTMDALAGGRFVVPYEVTSKGWHFTAFDAHSGQRLWDIALHAGIGMDDSEGFSLSASRVYIMRSSSLEIYDAKTGASVGTVGG